MEGLDLIFKHVACDEHVSECVRDNSRICDMGFRHVTWVLGYNLGSRILN